MIADPMAQFLLSTTHGHCFNSIHDSVGNYRTVIPVYAVTLTAHYGLRIIHTTAQSTRSTLLPYRTSHYR
jgi:hypothetical protein